MAQQGNTTMVRVGILGATGYTALELIKLLLRHPEVQIVTLTSRQAGNTDIASIHPQLTGQLDLVLENVDALAVAARVDCLFSCLPHGASAGAIASVLETDTRVVDFSADYRLLDVETYEHWYATKHPDPDRMADVVYGLPELYRERIVDAQLVANPGCYPTSAILAMAPLLKAGIVDPTEIIFDSKSGISGAGRTPKLTTHFPECNESVSAYNVGRHRHTPEISQILGHFCGSQVGVLFTPHLVPKDRGILTTAYARPAQTVPEEQVMDVLRTFYENAPFVRVVDHLPATKDCVGTNFCHVTARVVGDRIMTISCLDNLIKGASGAAVQNFNLMFGFSESTAL